MMTKVRWLIISIACLLAILLLFYMMFWRFITPFDANGMYSDGQVSPAQQIEFFEEQILPQFDLQNPTEESVFVFHWIDFDCKCTLLGKPFIEKITHVGKKQQVRHVILTKQDQKAHIIQTFKFANNATVLSLTDKRYQLSRLFIPASPAASIYYRQARSLSYLGPHSSGVTCGQGSNYIELVLNNLSHGFDPKLYELDSEGCFCQW